MAEDDEGEWLNLAQAAHRLGWPRERLRSLARRGKVRTMRGNAGQLLVLLAPGLEGQATVGLAQPSLAQEARPAEPSPAHPAQPSLAHEVADLRDELMEARERAARAEGELAATNRLVDQLRQELERCRRPWWLKLIGL
jgi:hypothetical protein